MTNLTFGALIPAAGESSRMDEFKPLVEIGGQTLVGRAVHLFKAAGVVEVVVVVGHRGDGIIPVLEGTSTRIVTNPDYREGMLTSIQAGARELRGRCDAFFVLPVDIPLVRPLTIRRLMERFAERPALVCHPIFDSRRGHPPLIDASLMDELLAFAGTGGLKVFLEGYADRSVDVSVADAWIRRDVDTDEELKVLRRDYKRYTILTPDECGVILTHYLNVPEAVQGHSRAVADIADRLGTALNAVGRHLDLDLLTAAGLLHDILKGHKGHAGRGAAWLRENGFPEVAAVVAEHTNILWKKGDPVDERALVYLADKILSGTELLTLDQRRAAAHSNYGTDETVRRRINDRFDAAEQIQAAVEKITGRTLSNILKSSGK